MSDYSRGVAEAILETYADIIARGQHSPSVTVRRRAATIIGAGVTSRTPAITYDVPSLSEERVHMVALYLKNKRDRTGDRVPVFYVGGRVRGARNEVVAARCSCDHRGELQDTGATEGRAPCSHIIAALALARIEGYRLEVPR